MFDKVTKSIRVISAAAVEKANSGHPGMPMGMAEVGTVLFKNVLKVLAMVRCCFIVCFISIILIFL